jgi:uncharacterized membrane protein YoaK (UPF0700 family)
MDRNAGDRHAWSGTVSAEAEGPMRWGPAPPVDNSRAAQALLIVLSVTAGCTDVIVVLNGLFAAHITGNLVILAAHIVGGGEAQIAPMLSVPVFIVMVGLTRLLAGGLESIGLASLRPLLLLQFLLLAGFLVLCVAFGPRIDPNAAIAILAGMLGVSAMAVQNALVQISLKGAPSTAVMTSNVTRFAMDVGELLLGGDPADVAKARNRAAHTLPAIVGFTVGCGLGAACEAALGTWSLALPAGLALLAFARGLRPSPGMDRADEPSRFSYTRFATNRLACCPASGGCATVRRSAAALWAAALGLGLSCPLRRVLARARKCLLGRHHSRDRCFAA